MSPQLHKITLPLLLSAGAMLAQVDTGTVTGFVSDPSGLGVARAKIRIIQEERARQTELTTDDSGFYAAPGLHAGRYVVTVDREGFRSQRSRPFDLRVQDRVDIRFQLEVGVTSSEVTVSATAASLESETSSLGQVIEGKTITDLPLNGRSFMQLATLGAGTLPSTRSMDRDSFISNGARSLQNSYLLDGIDNKTRIMGNDKSLAQVIQPVLDSIQEFKVQTSTFSAEFGQAAGGVVNVTLKSGTNELHGNVFEFLRNSRMDATPYFQPAGGGKPLFIQNQFGATLGGAVVRGRTFFFGSWQSTREVNSAPQIASVPTAPMRNGVFSGRVNDPATRVAFPNNTIPPGQWDPVAANLLPLYPLPNLPGNVRNFFYNPRERVSNDGGSVRMDHRLTTRDSMFARFSEALGENHLPTTLPDPANQQNFTDLIARSAALSETHVFAPDKVNEIRLGFSFNRLNQDILGPRLFAQYGIRGALDTPKIKGLPQFTITGLSTLGTTGPGISPIPATGANSGNFPSDKSGKIWQLVDHFSWVRRRHTMKFGADLQRVTMFIYATNSARPNLTFNGTYTGSAFGDFLTGYINTTATSQQQVDTIQQRVYSGYVQDDWKVSRVLTLNLGLRYELPKPFVEEFDRQANFVMDLSACPLQLVTVAERGRCGLPRALVFSDRNNFAPRLGFAWQPANKTVLRSGFGIFHGRDEDVGIIRRLPNNPPFITSATFAGDQSNPAFLLRNGFPANALGNGSIPDVINFPVHFPVSYVTQWNLNLERELIGSFLAQIGYTGSGAHKLPGLVNVNQPLPGTGSVNARRPYQGYGTILSYNPFINSTYHALVAKLERRFAGSATLLAAYTYGHSIDGGPNSNDANDPGPQDARNWSAQKGSSNFDIRQRLALSGLYRIPFGKKGGVPAALIRNWQLSGIFATQTGQPFTATLSTDPSGTSTTAHPNRLRDGSLPSGQRTLSRWFDISAFAAPACVCFGNSGRNILRGPGSTNLDAGLSRDFRLQERIRLQFRAEAFNLFNHPNFGLPGMAVGSPTAGIIGSVLNPERQIQLAAKVRF